MKPWVTVALFLLFAGVGHAQKTLPDAVKGIATLKVFAFGGIGYAGETSEGEVDFRVIIAQPPKIALDTFERLYSTDNPQSKSYALAGIRKLDKGEFNRLRLLLQSSRVKVQIEEGCIVSVHSLQDISDRLNAGDYDFWMK